MRRLIRLTVTQRTMKAGKFMQEATMEKLLDCLVTAGVDFYAPEDRPENGANGEKTPHPLSRVGSEETKCR